jgi:hypothetical protein
MSPSRDMLIIAPLATDTMNTNATRAAAVTWPAPFAMADWWWPDDRIVCLLCGCASVITLSLNTLSAPHTHSAESSTSTGSEVTNGVHRELANQCSVLARDCVSHACMHAVFPMPFCVNKKIRLT